MLQGSGNSQGIICGRRLKKNTHADGAVDDELPFTEGVVPAAQYKDSSGRGSESHSSEMQLPLGLQGSLGTL